MDQYGQLPCVRTRHGRIYVKDGDALRIWKELGLNKNKFSQLEKDFQEQNEMARTYCAASRSFQRERTAEIS
ncbi:hypothetical protein [Anaerolentibacter hominis]|uniref:hypothetical protein n=1 Tax=Anaerolentibacter hominis TaxID=3079009 RepID=UPI0031B80176